MAALERGGASEQLLAPTRALRREGLFLVKQLAIDECNHFAQRYRRATRGDGYERPTKRRVNTQLLSLFVAQRPPNSRRLVESEKASRIRLPGTPVTDPTAGHGGEEGALTRCCDSGGVGPSGLEDAGTSSTDGRNVEAAAATESSGTSATGSTPSERASSIIPSKRPRTETPRRAASASTQARRSWSSRMPTTVDLVVAMTGLTVIRGVYINGRKTVAAWWWGSRPADRSQRQRSNWAHPGPTWSTP
jgi:hypothetical protein